MSMLNVARVSRAPMAGLAAVGVFWGAFAAYIPDFKRITGASDAELGATLMAASVGGILVMWLAPRLSARLGRATLPLGAVILALALGYPLMARSVPALALALFGMGASVSFLDIGSNMRISDLEARHKLHLMNLNHAMFSFAFAGSALAASLSRRAGLPPEAHFPAAALVLVALALVMLERAPPPHLAAAPDAGAHGGLWGAILPVAAILFLAFVSENTTESWSALHIERTLGGPTGDGGFGPMMFGLTMGIGRVSGQVAAARLGEVGLIFWSALVGVIGALIIAFAPVPVVAIAGVGLMGLGVAVTVPSANSLLGRMVPADQRGFAISRAWMIGFTGFFIGPTGMGFVAQHAGLRTVFVGLALLMALMTVVVGLIARRQR